MNAGSETSALDALASEVTSAVALVEPESSSPLPDRLGSYRAYSRNGSLVSDSKCTRMSSASRLGSVV